MQQPAPNPLNTSQESQTRGIQVEAAPPAPSDLTTTQGSGSVDTSAWGAKEYPDAGTNDAFPPLEKTTSSAKPGKCARATARQKAATTMVNASVPGYAPPALDPNGTIPLSRITPLWLRTTTVAMTDQHQ